MRNNNGVAIATVNALIVVVLGRGGGAPACPYESASGQGCRGFCASKEGTAQVGNLAQENREKRVVVRRLQRRHEQGGDLWPAEGVPGGSRRRAPAQQVFPASFP